MEICVDERCECGKLLLKKTPKGIEFKCHRCKRIHVIPLCELTPEARDRESNAQ